MGNLLHIFAWKCKLNINTKAFFQAKIIFLSYFWRLSDNKSFNLGIT